MPDKRKLKLLKNSIVDSNLSDNDDFIWKNRESNVLKLSLTMIQKTDNQENFITDVQYYNSPTHLK